MMSFDHPHGVVGLKGTLLRRPSGYLWFAVSDGIVIDRRRATRAPVQLPVTLRRHASEPDARGTTVNISATGMLVATGLAAAVGETLHVAIDLGDNGGLTAHVHVTRCQSGLLAVHVDRNAREVGEALGAIVIERSRTVLQER
jgi:hypothetical protein